MAATVQINQRYGSDPGTQNNSVTTIQWLSADVSQATDVRSANPITKPGAGTNYSYETWQRLDVTAMGGSTSIDNIRVYCTSSPPTGYSCYVNANATPPNQAYATPVVTDSAKATTALPTSDPAGKRLTGTLSGTGQSSYLVTQLDVGTSATQAWDFTSAFYWVYEEVA
jgi:hypothetical protein